VRFGWPQIPAGEHNAQNLTIVTYVDYRLQARHSHQRHRKFDLTEYPTTTHITAQRMHISAKARSHKSDYAIHVGRNKRRKYKDKERE
jgi:hypothetical protein